MGKWKNHRKTIGKSENPWENHGKMEIYPLVEVDIAVENHHFLWENPLEMVGGSNQRSLWGCLGYLYPLVMTKTATENGH